MRSMTGACAWGRPLPVLCLSSSYHLDIVGGAGTYALLPFSGDFGLLRLSLGLPSLDVLHPGTEGRAGGLAVT